MNMEELMLSHIRFSGIFLTFYFPRTVIRYMYKQVVKMETNVTGSIGITNDLHHIEKIHYNCFCF